MRPYVPGQSFYNVIKRAIPDFAEAEYDTFVEFILAFLRFMEQERVLAPTDVRPDYGSSPNNQVLATQTLGEAGYEARKLQEYRDVTTTLDEFRTQFNAMFAKNWPSRTHLPLDLFIHSLREFYRGKGTVETIQFFFRSVFGRHADVHFPREDVLKASDATWSAPLTIKVGVPFYANTAARPNDDINTYFLGQRIVSPTGAAQVEKVTTTIYGQSYNQRIVVNELTLKYDTVVGDFEPGQTVQNIDVEDESQVVYATILPVIAGVAMGTGGSNYAVGDIVRFSEGPGLGEGYGAWGRVSRVSDSSINGVDVIVSGDGFTVGTPISFISSSGSGAAAVINSVIYGQLEGEDSNGFLLMENYDTIILEDKNTLDLLLTIDSFVNATATVCINTPDYGAQTGVVMLNGVDEYDPLSVALQAGDQAPFMTPWVFTGANTVQLANLGITLASVTNTWFANASAVFVLADEKDITTNTTNANTYATVIVAQHVSSLLKDTLYLNSVANLVNFTVGDVVKSNTTTTQVGYITTDGTANVVGNGTFFTTALRPNTHCVLDSGTQFVVASITNNVFLTAYSNVAAAVANTYATIPVGVITAVEPQQQSFYGKIRSISVTSPGSGYENPPSATVDAVSARAQEIQYWSGTTLEDSGGQIDIYEPASLVTQQDAGQVTRVEIVSSGVNYLEADAVLLDIIHGDGRLGDNASGTPILGAETQYPGRFTTTRSFLSADKVLQDAETYNDYTYQIRVAEPFERYATILTKLVHPAGFKMLGQFVATLKAETLDEGDLDTFETYDPVVVVDVLS